MAKKHSPLIVNLLDAKHKHFTEEFATMKAAAVTAEEALACSELEMSYYLDNSSHIFSYFEEKQLISSQPSSKTKTLNSFFRVDQVNTDPLILQNHAKQYLMNVDKTFAQSEQHMSNHTVCTKCMVGELIHVDFEGVVICNNRRCAAQFTFIVENEKPSYKDPPKEVCFYAYKRINHFREILAQFQAKESTQIPVDIIENIHKEIKKYRHSIATITNKETKDILKKFGHNKYYEHIPFIKDKLGIKPPVMGPELEDRLCNLFMELQRPYAKYCPEDRVNFLNYYYTIYKLCQLLEEDEFLPYFPMLKEREKRLEQDNIWKNICKDLNWQFIPTI
jgi:hypothetical protein